ncbi:TPA: DUF763 domain-containing protein [Candidatus Bipolaricaulota bacterium]|nr:DUF763 domain-containing protein [Candidatus Bipolaricaulota bacterium]
MRTGTAELPLHYGETPRWLFARMRELARQIAILMVDEFGTAEFMRRLADPFWFQALGSLLGFDWHSSGLTTTTGAALKEGIRGLERDIGLFIAGGKGATSRKAPQEITDWGPELKIDPAKLTYASRMSAKVDNSALQDGYQIYHHLFIFDREGRWAVVQQGMNEATGYARRYHWLGGLRPDPGFDFVEEPHTAICCDRRGEALNMVSRGSSEARQISAELACKRPERLAGELKHLGELSLPPRHRLLLRDIHPERLEKIFLKTYERQPGGFEELLSLERVGPKTIRALALLSELVYGAKLDWRDPARYSFAHGGKDGHPYPVDRRGYDRTIAVLRKAIVEAKLGRRERLAALRRLARWEA